MKQIINVFQRVVIGLNKIMYMKASGAMHVNALKNTSFYLETILEKALANVLNLLKSQVVGLIVINFRLI